jgi:hypothetical protein
VRDEPLGLPKGSVRAIIALFVLSAVIIGVFVRNKGVELLIPIAGMVVGYYFGSRSDFGGNGNG